VSAGSPDLSGLTLLISHDRSGSHFLGSFIRALKDCRMVDEVCNEDALDPTTDPLSFFGFRHRRAAENPDFELRRKPHIVSALLDEYFAFVVEQSTQKTVTIDVKYGHVHNFEVAWWPIFRKPFLFEYVRTRRLRLIHLSRWNSLETLVSGYVAESRKLWHAIGDRPAAQPSEAVVVELSQLAEQIALLNAQKAAFHKWTHALRCLTVTYEELVHPSAAEGVRAQVARFLDTDVPENFASPYRKVTPPLHQIVRNWEELRRFCQDNELAHYLVPMQ
jgi:hypothetical protein